MSAQLFGLNAIFTVFRLNSPGSLKRYLKLKDERITKITLVFISQKLNIYIDIEDSKKINKLFSKLLPVNTYE